MLFDDDIDQRELYRTVLEEAGYAVLEAQNGEEGVQLYRRYLCDLVVIDIFMPEKEGIETILELRQEFPQVKIIAVSGGGFEGSYAGEPGANVALETAKNFGANHVFHKPLQLARFLSAINELVQNR